VESVRLKKRLPCNVVLDVIGRRLAAQVDWMCCTALGVLGLDEIALKKGHRDPVVIVMAHLQEGQIAIMHFH